MHSIHSELLSVKAMPDAPHRRLVRAPQPVATFKFFNYVQRRNVPCCIIVHEGAVRLLSFSHCFELQKKERSAKRSASLLSHCFENEFLHPLRVTVLNFSPHYDFFALTVYVIGPCCLPGKREVEFLLGLRDQFVKTLK
jgi:hypothetical protein